VTVFGFTAAVAGLIAGAILIRRSRFRLWILLGLVAALAAALAAAGAGVSLGAWGALVLASLIAFVMLFSYGDWDGSD
jgi:hypothetical protein